MQPAAADACPSIVRVAAALVACIPLAVPSPALADDAAARALVCSRALAAPPATEVARVHLLLDLCLTVGDPGARRGEAEAARARALATLHAGDFAPVDIVVTPASAQVTVAALGDLAFTTPRTVWLPLGTHEVRATAPGHQGGSVTVSIRSRDPGPPLRLTLLPAVAPAPGEAEVDFSEEGAAGDVESASDLPQAKHDELLKDKYRRGLAARGEDDQPAPPRLRAGIRLGAGPVLLDGEGADGAVLLRAGAGARYRISGPLAVQVEPAAQAILGEQRVWSLSLPVLLAAGRWRAGPALNVHRSDRTRAELAAVLAATVWRGFEARIEAGVTQVDGTRIFAFLLQWDSGG